MTGLADPTVQSERRAARRYHQRLPVVWPDGAGYTRDVSRLGAYLFTPSCVRVKDTLDVHFAILSPDLPTALRVRCRAEVVRVDEPEDLFDGSGVGIRFREVDFEGFGADGGFGWLERVFSED